MGISHYSMRKRRASHWRRNRKYYVMRRQPAVNTKLSSKKTFRVRSLRLATPREPKHIPLEELWPTCIEPLRYEKLKQPAKRNDSSNNTVRSESHKYKFHVGKIKWRQLKKLPTEWSSRLSTAVRKPLPLLRWMPLPSRSGFSLLRSSTMPPTRKESKVKILRGASVERLSSVERIAHLIPASGTNLRVVVC